MSGIFKLCRCLTLISFTVIVLYSNGARAQRVDLGSQSFDCVIEPHRVVEVGSSVDGILEEISVQRGDFVDEGQVLARLKSEVEQTSVELARVRAQYNVAIETGRSRLKFFESKQQRIETLYKNRVASTEALEIAQTEGLIADYELKTAEFEKRLAKVELKRAKAILARRTIVSPMAGIVTERMLSPGAFIYEQAMLLTLAQIDPLNVEVYIPISAYGLIRTGMLGEVRPVEPVGGVYRAEVTIVDVVFDAASGTFGVRLELPNPEQQIPAGLKCSVRFLPGAS